MSTATPGAVAATFPAELEECIIDELYYDIRALRNCTLTCRRWLPRTRYHLFAAIRVRTKDELLSLCALLSRSSHLLPLVRSLTIRAQRDHPEAAHLFQIVPFKLLASLPSLVCWKLSGLSHPNRRWTNAEKQVDYYTLPCHRMGLATIRRIATTVQELYLNRLSFISPVDCARLVSSLPALRELCCVDIGYRMRQDPEVVDTCIDRLPPCVHIETLSLIRVQTRAAYSLLRLLQSTVETLTIDVRMASYDPTVSLVSRFVRLQSLKLFVHVDCIRVVPRSFNRFASGIKLATNILKSLVRLHALTIIVDYKPEDLHRLSEESWGTDETEICQRFAEVAVRLDPSHVLFIVPSGNGRERTVFWTQTLQRVFPTLHKRWPLRVEFQSVLPNKPPYRRAVIAIAASPDGQWIASRSKDQTLTIWRVDRGDEGTLQVEVAFDWPTEYTAIPSLEFSPDSKYLASLRVGGEQGWFVSTAVICIWCVSTGTLLGTLVGPIQRLRVQVHMAWLRDGTLVASVPQTRRLLRWCTMPTKDRTGSGLTTPPSSVAVPPDAIYSFTDRGLVQLVDGHQPDTETLPSESATHALFSPDGSQLVLWFHDGSVLIWDVDFGALPSPPRRMRPRLPMSIEVHRDTVIDVSDMARQFLVLDRGRMPRYAVVCRIDSNAPTTSESLGRITAYGYLGSMPSMACLSPCGRLVATMHSISVSVWRVVDNRDVPFTFESSLPRWREERDNITCGTFTQNSTLVYGTSTGTVVICGIGKAAAAAAL